MVSDSIPTELILEILLRLPAKSITRFHCVSKQWASMLRCPSFTELFLTRSLVQPRLLFALEQINMWSFFSLPQHHSRPYEKSSSPLEVAANFHMKFPPGNMKIYPSRDRQFSCGYASGLTYFYGMWIKPTDSYGVPVICNPITGRYAALPYLQRYRKAFSFFGFDPIDKQFKVFFMAYPSGPDDHQILTLGTEEMKWKRIKCPIIHEIASEGICINGVLYYVGDTSDFDLGDTSEKMPDLVIVCFDVRSETFKFIYPEKFCQLIKYKGKLGVIYYDSYDDNAIELRLWVLEDVEKQEWSKYAYNLKGDNFTFHNVFVVGATAIGEIVLSMGSFTSGRPFYVFYFNPERKTFRPFEIQGFGERYNHSKVYVFVTMLMILMLTIQIYSSQASKLHSGRHRKKNQEQN